MPTPAAASTIDLMAATAERRKELRRALRRIAKGHAKPEHVHRLRSNARRMESVLVAFVGVTGRAGRRAYRLERDASDLRKAAGGVRDADVSCELVRGACRSDSAARERLESMLERRREKAVKELIGAAGRRRARAFPDRLEKGLESAELSVARARRVLKRQIAHVRAAARGGLPPRALHRVRIALKRLRDLAEFVADGIPGAAKLSRTADHLCDTLGKSQDLVILTELVARAMKETSDPPASLTHLRRECLRRHHSAHLAAVRALAALEELGLPA